MFHLLYTNAACACRPSILPRSGEHRKLPPTLQTALVVIETADLQKEYDAAVAAFEYARRIGNLLKDYTGRIQSIGKQVELTYRSGS